MRESKKKVANIYEKFIKRGWTTYENNTSVSKRTLLINIFHLFTPLSLILNTIECTMNNHVACIRS